MLLRRGVISFRSGRGLQLNRLLSCRISQKSEVPSYETLSQSVLESLLAEECAEETAMPEEASFQDHEDNLLVEEVQIHEGSYEDAPKPLSVTVSGLEDCVAERQLDDALRIFHRLQDEQIRISGSLQEKLINLCYSSSHRFEYAVKLIEVKTKLGLEPFSRNPTSSQSIPSDPLKAFDHLLRESNARFLEMAKDDPLQALSMFGELFDIQPKVEALSFQTMIGNLSPLYLTKLKFAIRARKPSVEANVKIPGRTGSGSRDSHFKGFRPLPTVPELSLVKVKPIPPALLSVLEDPQTQAGWEVFVRHLPDIKELAEPLQTFHSVRDIFQGQENSVSLPTNRSELLIKHLQQLQRFTSEANRLKNSKDSRKGEKKAKLSGNQRAGEAKSAPSKSAAPARKPTKRRKIKAKQ